MKHFIFSRRFREHARLLQWQVFSSSVQRDWSTFLLICSTLRPANFLGSEKQRERGFESSTKPQNCLMLPKVKWRRKGSPLGFFGTVTFSENFWILSKCTLLIFLKLSVCRKRSEPKGSLFGFFGNMRLFLSNSFEKKSKCKIVFFWCFQFRKKAVSSFGEENPCGTLRHCVIIEKFHNSCSFNIFEPYIWPRLGPFPACFCYF